MNRSTVVLSLVTLLALGGCNAPSDSNPSTSNNSTSSAAPEQLAETSPSSTTTSDKSETAPPANVSQPLDSPSGGTTDIEPSTISAIKEPVAETNTAKPNTSDNTDDAAVQNTGVTVQSAQAVMADTSIVPGEKVGIVTGSTTYADLESTFGRDRLITEEIHLGEGMMAPSTQVALDDGYSFNVVWSDESQAKPLEVRDLDTGWKIQGIYNGMSFDDLKAALGDFELLGLGWDYGGTLLLENTSLAAHSGQLFIRVQPSEKAVETQQEKFLAVAGDSAFSSSDPNFEALDLSVVEVVVRLE